jgi:hypothetical protein
MIDMYLSNTIPLLEAPRLSFYQMDNLSQLQHNQPTQPTSLTQQILVIFIKRRLVGQPITYSLLTLRVPMDRKALPTG